MKIFIPIITFLTLFNLSSNTLLMKIKDTLPHCLGSELMKNSILTLKYKIFTSSKTDLSNILGYFTLFAKHAKTQKKIKTEHIFLSKGKYIFDIAEEGLYDICIQMNRQSALTDLKEDIFVNFKVGEVFSSSFNYIPESIESKDINSINQKIKQITELTEPINENLKNQLEVENEHSLKTLSNTKIYKYLTYAQLFITIIIGVIQIGNFRRFLKSQHLI